MSIIFMGMAVLMIVVFAIVWRRNRRYRHEYVDQLDELYDGKPWENPEGGVG